jgi:hypothetical protein
MPEQFGWVAGRPLREENLRREGARSIRVAALPGEVTYEEITMPEGDRQQPRPQTEGAENENAAVSAA